MQLFVQLSKQHFILTETTKKQQNFEMKQKTPVDAK
jgi:hypothetical protein